MCYNFHIAKTILPKGVKMYKNFERGKFLTTHIQIGNTPVDIYTEGGPSKGILKISYDSHFHTSHEVYLVEAGSLKLECDGKVVELTSGDLFVVKAQVPHRIIECSSDFARFTLRFLLNSDEFTDSFLKDYLHIVPSSRERGEILDAVKHLRVLHNRKLDNFEYFRLKAYYSIIFSYILGPFCITELETEKERFSRLTLYSRIENYFHMNCDKQITLDSLACYLSYSKAQTGRILLECKGASFSKVLRDTRIDKAKKLLRGTNLPISDIALQCGYDTRQGFELMFGKTVGITPKAYRENNH